MAAKTFLNTKLAISVFFVVLAVAGSVHAKILYVDDDGPSDFNDIQTAIDDANDGDAIIVADGFYWSLGYHNYPVADFHGKAITLQSENGPENCILAGGDNVVRFLSGETCASVLSGFTIKWADPSGGICCYDSSPTIMNNIITKNWSEYGEGAILVHNSSAVIIGNIITGNDVYGPCAGIVCCHGSYATITNNTIVNNGIYGGEGDVYCDEISTATITNCIFWNNNGEYDLYNCSATYSCTEHAEPGIGNIDINPMFVNLDDGDYHLQPGSPCIDSGSDSAVSPSLLTDPEGNPRIMGPTVDMGSYEHMDQGYVLNTRTLIVPEGGIASFTVALVLDPCGVVEVTVDVESGDADITIKSPGSLMFDSSDYSKPQTVTLTAAEDTDYFNSTAVITVNAPGFCIITVIATEQDNDDAPTILYVDGNIPSSGDGTSWADAFTDLQYALKVAATYDGVREIRVADGVYTPAGLDGDRRFSFPLVNGVSIKGGYAGFGARKPDTRDVNKYKTVLSGDLNGNDSEIVPDQSLYDPSRADNSYHVVVGSWTDETTVLDGLIITAGNADVSAPNISGGAIYICKGSIINCIITGNQTYGSGGGLYRCDGPITGCSITDNSAGYGAGLYECDGPIVNCAINENHAIYGGGGMYGCDGTISTCNISWNSAGVSGGGITNSYSTVVITNCIFIGNVARQGGAMRNYKGLPKITSCVFSNNLSEEYGGAIINSGNKSVLTNCTFTGNSSRSGGGVFNYDSSPTLVNCRFTANSADWGSGMFNEGRTAHPSLVNCTFSGNMAGEDVAVISNSQNKLTLSNCILWDNNTDVNWPQIYAGGTGVAVTAEYSNIQGGWPGEGNIDTDPCFVHPVYWWVLPQLSPFASEPNPANGAVGVNITADLRWTAGQDAVSHDVYFGTTSHPLFVCNQTSTTFDPGMMAYDTKYYWRIDEVNDSSITTGYNWSFTTFISPPPTSQLLTLATSYTSDIQQYIWIEGDYHLLPDSPCINAGDPNYVAEPNETDLDGRPRVIRGRIDMGAYEYSPPIQADIRIIPRTINLRNKGQWIAAFLRLPEDCNVTDIDPNSIFLEDKIKPEQFSVDEQEQIAAARFNREDVQAILDIGEVELTITGRLSDGTAFKAADTIKVIGKAGKN